MKKFRGLIIHAFVSLLRYVSVKNYRKTIKSFVKIYNPQINIKFERKKVVYDKRLVRLGYSNSEKYWSILYTHINGITSNDYIPESIYYFEVEPRLNNLIFRLPYSDKNNFIGIVLNNANIFPSPAVQRWLYNVLTWFKCFFQFK